MARGSHVCRSPVDVVSSEERLLHSEFGAEYEAYSGRPSRLIPGLY